MIHQMLGSEQLLIWGMNVLLQVTLLTVVSLSIASCIRRRPAVRYWVLFAAMVLILACPAIVSVMQSSGTGLITVSLPEPSSGVEQSVVTPAVAGNPNAGI